MEPTAQRTDLAQSRPLPIAVLVNSRCLLTDSAGHDIRAGLHRLTAISRTLPPPATCLQQNIGFQQITNLPSDSCLSCPVRVWASPLLREEKDPGSAFGPEAVPLATGLVPVVYWVPGPFPGPTPHPAG